MSGNLDTFMVLFSFMLPVLFSIGNLSVSSFGIFLALGFLMAVFLVWRLARSWDLDEEKILDLTLLTFLGGLIGARLYFGLENWQFFSSNPFRLLLILKYPGFSFWGGILGGWLILYFFTKKFKVDFWQAADIGAVGFFGGLIFADMGCLLGGCGAGIPSQLPLAVPMVSLVGKRLPVQAIEALLLTLVLFKIWSVATHFHLRGKIVSMSFIYLGIIKLAMDPLRQDPSGYFFPLSLIVLGITIFYRINVGKRTPISDLRLLTSFLLRLVTDATARKLLIEALLKSWYNQKILILWKLRRFRVRSAPKNTTNY